MLRHFVPCYPGLHHESTHRRDLVIAVAPGCCGPRRGRCQRREPAGGRDRGHAAGPRLAPRFPPAPGTQQPRSPHLEDRGRRAARAGARSADRHRAHRRGRHPARRQARPDDRVARRHGRTARHRAGGRAVQVGGDGRVPRREGGRDACLRPRRAHGGPAGCGQSPGGHEGRAARHGDVRVPAGRRRRARRRARRREPDAGRRPVCHHQARCHARAAPVVGVEYGS